MWYYYAHIRLAKIKKCDNIKYKWGCEKQELWEALGKAICKIWLKSCRSSAVLLWDFSTGDTLISEHEATCTNIAFGGGRENINVSQQNNEYMKGIC